jgi:fatty acid desaturase
MLLQVAAKDIGQLTDIEPARLIVGRDPEIAVMRPARLARLLVNLVGLVDVPLAFASMFRHAAGRLTADEADFVPASERHKVYRTARIDLAIYAATIGLAIGFRSWLPVVLIGGPRLYGALLLYFYSFTQHAGMGENVLDYRLNTRTVKMCRINRFLYWNMNYHVEHHMFPMVPYYRLPELHETAWTTRSTGRRATSTTPPKGTARTRRPCCAMGWSWGG